MAPNSESKSILNQLLDKGVRIPCPESVEIGPDINPERVSGDHVTIYSGCKIFGPKTLIMSGVELGYEAPVTVHNCQLGKNVKLKGGFFYDACFLEGSGMGSGAQIREACLLEEGAKGAHTVGLKQTILLPFVTLGSLINFCDCLMAGGTDEKNHSEVGSSYIHFNYTPNQDKATPSLMGDVPRGVMINQRPIFLGGQGGVVGPVRIDFGNVVAAGTIVRKDILKENTILLGSPTLKKSWPFHPGLYNNVKRIIDLNTGYIANLVSLRRWYLDVRSELMNHGPMDKALLEGALEKLDKAIQERFKRLGVVASRMPRSIEIHKEITKGNTNKALIQRKQEFTEKWPELEQAFKDSLAWEGDSSQKDRFLSTLEKASRAKGDNYVDIIRGLDEDAALAGTLWLQGIVDKVTEHIWNLLPSFGEKR